MERCCSILNRFQNFFHFCYQNNILHKTRWSSDESENVTSYSLLLQVEDAINNLDAGKSCGLDGIYSEHLKYSSIGYRIWIAKCMTSFLVHGQLPESLMSVVLVPIIKDKSGKINSKDNYRPIAIASIMSKLIEKLLLERLSIFLLTSPHQFGFKPKHSTDACIYVLKESIDRYVEQQSSVYLCFSQCLKSFQQSKTFFHYLIN